MSTLKKQLNLSLHSEEFWNAASHAMGVVLGLIGFIFLLVYNANETPYSSLAIFIYGFSLILLYTISTLYHLVKNIPVKKELRRLDHISIYFLIAGTYTPVALITLYSGSGWTVFWTVWIVALLGTLLKIFFTGRFEILSLALYLLMGWLIVIYFEELMGGTTQMGRLFLMLGGAAYTVGTVFYALKCIPFNHFIWHLFVLLGSFCHFMFIINDVI